MRQTIAVLNLIGLQSISHIERRIREESFGDFGIETSTTEEPATPLAEVGARIAARRVELGRADVPRNSGARRTESKRALLKAIEDAGGKW